MLELHKQVRARKDLEGMWLYSFQKWGEKQADQYYDEIIKGMNLIVNHPEIGIVCDDIKKGYRCFTLKEYDVYYRITKTRIIIIRVLHESMKPALHL
jgi:toxin ParE1/3/4